MGANFFAFSTPSPDTSSTAKSNFRPLPFSKKGLLDKEPSLEKTIADGSNQIKYTDNKNIVDCIFYEILTNKNKYEIGEKVILKIKITFYDNLYLSYKDEECQKIALKVVFPQGFSQYGGNYQDFIPLSFDKLNNSQELEIIGQFNEFNANPCFTLLKGPFVSNWETIFIKKGERCLTVSNKILAQKQKAKSDKQKIDRNNLKNSETNSIMEACSPPNTTSASRCGEGVVNLLASGCTGEGAIYTWYDHPTAGNELGTSTDGTFTTASINASTTYSVTCTTNTCSISSRTPVSITIVAPAAPFITASGATSFCERSSVDLTASTCNGTILWSSGQIDQTLTVTTSGTYSATCTEFGCPASLPSNAISVNVTPSPLKPTVTASRSLTLCQGETVDLTASTCTGGTLFWSNGQSIPTITVNTAGDYSVTCTQNACPSLPSEIISVVVNITPPPTITPSGPLIFCQGGAVDLTASSCTGGAILWSNGQTSQTITVNTTGNYSVICTQNSCPSLSSELTSVTVNSTPTPTITASGPLTFCDGGAVTLTTSACTNGSILWSNGQITNSINVSTSGSYTVVCTQNGCISGTSLSKTIVVTTIPPPTVSANRSLNLCSGQSVILTASACTGGSFLWSNNATSQSISISSAGNYSVRCTKSGCTSQPSLSSVVTVTTSPTKPSINPSNYLTYKDICLGTTYALSTSCNVGSLTWSNGATTSTTNVTPTTTTVYTATCNNSGCITQSNNFTVNVTPYPSTPTVSASGPLTFCEGKSVVLTSSACPNGTVLWSNGMNTIDVTIKKSGTYTVKCKNTGCESPSSSPMIVNVTQTIQAPTIDLIGSQNVCNGSGSTLTSNNCSGSVVWSNGVTNNILNVISNSTTNQAVLQPGPEQGKDTQFNSIAPNGTSPNNQYVSSSAWTWNSNLGVIRSLLFFDISSLPQNSKITNANLELFHVPTSQLSYGSSNASFLKKIIQGWNESSATWTNQPATSETNKLTIPDSRLAVRPKVDLNVTELIKEQFLDPENNFGFQLSLQTVSTYRNLEFGSSDYPTASYRPKLTIDYTASNVYFAKCVDVNGCSSPKSNEIELTIQPSSAPSPPVISVVNNANTNFCEGSTIQLTATTCNGTISWSNGSTAQTITVLNGGSYFATCSSGTCTSPNSNTITVTVNTISQAPTITASSTTICEGNNISIESSGCNGTVTWSNGSTGIGISVSSPGTYNATCTNGTQCISPASNSIIISEGFQPPTPILTATKTTICQGSTEPITLSAANCDGTINWQWTNADLSTGITTSIGDLIVSDITQTRTYKASCTNGCGTSPLLSADLVINVQNLEITGVTSNTPVNAGYPLNLSVVAPLGNTYSWSGPTNFTSTVQNPAITSAVISNSGTYTVTVTSVAGCTATGTVVVTVVPDDCHCEADINLPEWQTEIIVNNAIFIDNSLTNVVENTYLAPTTTIDGTTELNQTITYADGFGRPMQVINRGLSPTGKDIIQPIEYDHFGRNTTNYLPYVGITNGAFQQNAIVGNANTYASSAQSLFYADPQFKNDANAFSKTIIENSPLSRVIQQGSVGSNWQPNEIDPSLANTVKMAYRHNSETDIKKFDFNHDTEKWTISTYGANELFVTETKDEKNNKIEEFTNILGQIICKKVYNTTNNEVLITYNAYDEFGRNRFVLPPMATAGLPTNPDLDFFPKGTPEIKDFIFYYDFDARGRLIEKKTPDAEPEEMVYNPFDQLILVRNALQKSKGIWVYTKYDDLGRPYVSGTYANSGTRAAVLSALNASFAANKYGEASFPSSNIVEKSRTYYDEYPTTVITNMMGTETPLTATAPSEFSFYGTQACNTCAINLKDKVTATVVQLEIPTGANLSLIQKTSLLSVQYYDEFGRTIQTRSDNHMGKTEISSVKYDFAGRVLETVKTTGDQATDNYKEWNKNTYDKGQRLKMTVQQLSDKLGGIEKVSKAEPVGRYKYNEIGEMIEKWQGCKQQVITTQTNIKGWLLNINGTADPATLKTKKQFFGMELTYDQADGQISQANWGTIPSFAANAQLPGIRGYAYQYDALGRILSGTYSNSTDQNEKFSLSGMSYDLNGNIKTLQRTYKKTINGTTVDVSPDILNYTYAIGNRLKKVDDTGNETGIPADKNPYFKDNNTTEEDYEYDFGGNLIKDKNRKIAITYNYLGLPEKVVYDNTTNIYYVYDASGNKVQKQNAPMPQQGVMVNKTMNYIGNMLFMGNELQQISTAEGRALPALAPTALVPATSTLTLGYRYEYIQTDYFGNARTACRCGGKTNETGEIIPTPAGEDAISLVQENHYDPWGLNLSNIESKVASPLNHYQFNGNSEKGFLPNGDFDYETPFRNYNPALGRFMQVDLMSSQYVGISGYNFANNNPVLLNDPTGLFPGGPIIPINLFNLGDYFNPRQLNEVVVTAKRTFSSFTFSSMLQSVSSGISWITPPAQRSHFYQYPFPNSPNGGSVRQTDNSTNLWKDLEEKANQPVHSPGEINTWPIFYNLVYGVSDGVYSIVNDNHISGTAFENHNDRASTTMSGWATLFGGSLIRGIGSTLNTASKGVLNPNEIHFMQSSIKNTTGEFTVLGNSEALANGSLNPNVLRMNVWKDASGKVWTLDHRRLAAFRLSGLQEAPIQWTNPSGQMWKMTTTNGGTSIKLKLGGGNNMIIK